MESDRAGFSGIFSIFKHLCFTRFSNLVTYVKTVSRCVWMGLDRKEFPSGKGSRHGSGPSRGDDQAGRGQDRSRVEVKAGEESKQEKNK